MKNMSTLIMALLATAMAGCGTSEPKPNLVPATGTISVNGTPLANAEVHFVPDSSNKDGKIADDTTGPQGNYKVKTNGEFGVVPGLYKIQIVKALPVSSEALARHPGDPFMAKLSMAGPDLPKDKKKEAGKEGDAIKEEFTGSNVTTSGAKLDFDIKLKAPSAPVPSKKK